MIHIFNKSETSNKVIIALHGTGSNEVDFASIANYIDPNASILSIRGNINENGMNRFFERYGMGRYNIESYEEQTTNLYEMIVKSSKEYNFDLNNAYVVGFSNGANIALGLIQDYPTLLNNYMLLSPDYINKSKDFSDLSNLSIFISSSKNDPYASYDNIELLINNLKDKNAKVETYLGVGHQVDGNVITETIKWYKK